MRVLWVKSGGLVPLDTGGKIRSYNLLKELARKHEVTLFTFYPQHVGDEHPQLERIVRRVICLPLRLPSRASFSDCIDYALNLFSGRPYPMAKYCRPEVAHELRRHLETDKYDVILCDFLLTAAVIPWDLPCPKVIFTHNVEAVIWQRHYQVSRNPFFKAISYREFRTMACVERRYLETADHVLTVSENDKQTFTAFLDPEKITVIPTGVDVDYFRPTPEEERNTLVFTGSMDWMPNEDGITWFAEQILPRICARIPVALYVVGRSPSARLKALAATNPGIKITGRVDDVRPYMGTSSVYLVPLRIGGGTRIKIFEAMAMAKPIVSTAIGAEGLPVQHGRDIILADTPESFSAEVLSLLGDDERRRQLGTAARATVEQSYSWTAVAAHLNAVLEQTARSSRAATAGA